MPKKTKLPPEDMANFEQAMAGTKRLISNKVRLTPPVAKKTRPMEKESTIKPWELREFGDIASVGAQDYISYKHTSISHKTLRNLRKGQYNVEAILDLHGMTVEKSRVAVIDFLQECLRTHMRIVLIVHGKGSLQKTPILKNKLNQWLRHLEAVLAFCSAAPGHGSRGAIYVLLKRGVIE